MRPVVGGPRNTATWDTLRVTREGERGLGALWATRFWAMMTVLWFCMRSPLLLGEKEIQADTIGEQILSDTGRERDSETETEAGRMVHGFSLHIFSNFLCILNFIIESVYF